MPRLLTPTLPVVWQTDVAVQAAAAHLATGGLLGLPTETVYGLAADAHQAEAVRHIFSAKGRPADHPLIVHLAPDWREGVAHHTEGRIPDFAYALMHAYWPGPLTLILPRRAGYAEAAAGGQPSVGVRCPSHPVAQAVLQAAHALGVYGVAAPSANRFGRVSPTTAAHVLDEFAHLSDDALLVLDGGACTVGIESTIVDATRGVPVLLRPGMIGRSQLEAVCGQQVYVPEDAPVAQQATPKASGTLASHYAPNAQVRLMDAHALEAAVKMVLAVKHPTGAPRIAVYAAMPAPAAAQSRRSPVLWRTQPRDAESCAQELFAVLRELDAQGVSLIWVQAPPATPEWDGVRDRLQRAAA